MYMIAVQGVGGGRNRICIMYWTPRGRGVGLWVSPSHGGYFYFETWVLNTGFWMRYKSLINIKS